VWRNKNEVEDKKQGVKRKIRRRKCGVGIKTRRRIENKG
jgi:hypothetical protein